MYVTITMHDKGLLQNQTAMMTRGVRKAPILVADDAPDTRFIIARTLEFEDFKCVQATNGEEALEGAIKYRPSVILLDLMLPKMDGLKIMMQLKRLNIPTKICIVSAIENPALIRRAMEFGASSYIVKPVNPDIVLHQIRSLTNPSPIADR